MSSLCADSVSRVLSHLSPGEVLSCSLVCRSWAAAAQSDTVWSAMLPPVFHSPAVQAAPEIASAASFREAYIALSKGVQVQANGGSQFVTIHPLTARVTVRVNVAEVGHIARGETRQNGAGGGRQNVNSRAFMRPAAGSTFKTVPVITTTDWFDVTGSFHLPFLFRTGHYRAAWRISRRQTSCCGDIGPTWQLPCVRNGAFCDCTEVHVSSSIRFADAMVPQDSTLLINRMTVPPVPCWTDVPVGYRYVKGQDDPPPLVAADGSVNDDGRHAGGLGRGAGVARSVDVEVSLREAGSGRCSFYLDSFVLEEVESSNMPLPHPAADVVPRHEHPHPAIARSSLAQRRSVPHFGCTIL